MKIRYLDANKPLSDLVNFVDENLKKNGFYNVQTVNSTNNLNYYNIDKVYDSLYKKGAVVIKYSLTKNIPIKNENEEQIGMAMSSMLLLSMPKDTSDKIDNVLEKYYIYKADNE